MMETRITTIPLDVYRSEKNDEVTDTGILIMLVDMPCFKKTHQ